jgi:hypothetical protein
MFREVDREGRRIGTGLEGEESTARELRRLRRHGWRVIHNLQFAYGDVDHIAVGPGGVAVIEPKAGNADWQWHVDHGIPGQWLGQVRKNGQRVQALIKQLSGHEVAVQMFIATWINDEPHVLELLTPTVSQLPGGQLAECLRALDLVLDKRETRTIAKNLDQQARQWDADHGVRHPSTVRRLLGLG